MSFLPIALFCATAMALLVRTYISGPSYRNKVFENELQREREAHGDNAAWQKTATDRRFRPAGIRDWMQVAISLIVLVAALFIVISKAYEPADKHWAYGSLGTILGYWLKGGR
jgi:hypothetical protein